MTDFSFYILIAVGTIVGFGIGYLLAQAEDENDFEDPDGE